MKGQDSSASSLNRRRHRRHLRALTPHHVHTETLAAGVSEGRRVDKDTPRGLTPQHVHTETRGRGLRKGGEWNTASGDGSLLASAQPRGKEATSQGQPLGLGHRGSRRPLHRTQAGGPQ